MNRRIIRRRPIRREGFGNCAAPRIVRREGFGNVRRPRRVVRRRREGFGDCMGVSASQRTCAYGYCSPTQGGGVAVCAGSAGKCAANMTGPTCLPCPDGSCTGVPNEGFRNVRRPRRVVRREGFGNVRRPCAPRVVRRYR